MAGHSELEPGSTLGRFRIDAQLGKGGMGVVYEATDTTLQRQVALKVLPAHLCADEERRGRLVREARAAAQLAHPNIATVYEVGEDGGRVFVALELVRGRTLRARIGDGALPVAEALAVALAICEALARAHEKGVVHRDLKPDNVMLSHDGGVKVLDFGLAKLVDQDGEAADPAAPDRATATALTEMGRILGTPGYMSPEQATGKPVDHRTDLFAVGVMLFEMLTGAQPFGGDSAMEKIVATTRDDPGAPSARGIAVSPGLDAVVARCLAKLPGDRWPTARTLADALKAVDDERAREHSLDAVASKVTARGAERNRSGRVVLFALAALLAVALVAVALKRERAGGAAPVASASASAPASSAPAPSATTLSALPVPKSKDPAAVAAHVTGVQAMRDGVWHAARRHFDRAVSLDPDLPETHLRLAVEGAFNSDSVSAREHFAKAFAARARLGERDRAFLDAIEPVAQRTRTDPAEAARRLAALTERHPGDAELYVLRGWLMSANPEEGLRAADRAAFLDPHYADAWQLRGQSLSTLGRSDESAAAFDRCVSVSSGSFDCLTFLVAIHELRGACAEMERTARMTVDRAGAFGHLFLASALHATGRPPEVVMQSVDQIPDDSPNLLASKLFLRVGLALSRGDFVEAGKLAKSVPRRPEDELELRSNLAETGLRLYLALETGDTAEAHRVATAFARKHELLSEPTSLVPLHSAGMPGILRFAVDAKALSSADFERWREGWVERNASAPRGLLWTFGYAAAARTPEEAAAALKVAPAFEPLNLGSTIPGASASAARGRAFLLAGDLDRASAALEDAGKSCPGLSTVFPRTRAMVWLGEVRERRGQTEEACAAYGEVVRRWGDAKPRSVSAERARERMKALRCAG